jgi:thiopeptide-type bacteriocin biosynthesis protein
MLNADAEWLSMYVFYTGDVECLLKHEIKRFVGEKIQHKLLEQFFFIRYWDRGPHLRLRFKGKKENLDKYIKPELEELIKKFLAEHPSPDLNPADYSYLQGEKGLLPNNSIHYFIYEPEFDRYGGPGGITISEKQFEASSKAVLSVLSDDEEAWDYDKAMGVAIQMHLSFAHACGMNLKEAAHFYSGIFQAWLYLAYDWKNISREEHLKKHKIVLDAFEDQFTKQREGLVPFHNEVWDALESGEEFEEQWMNKWIGDMQTIHSEITAAQKNNLLTFPEDSAIPGIWNVPAETKRLWFIYSSYVHMTNNRLGILNRDEAFLGYLVKRSLEVLTSETGNV